MLRQQHHGHGLAHHQAAADDHCPLALGVDAVVVENFHTGLGGTGGEAQIFSGKDAGVGQIRHAVHILFREQTVADLILGLPQTAAQRAQHEAAVYAGIGIDPVDDGQNLFFGGLLRQKEFSTSTPTRAARVSAPFS